MVSVKEETNKVAVKSEKELPKLLEFKTGSSTPTKYVYVGKRSYNQLNSTVSRNVGNPRNSSRSVQSVEQQAQNIDTPVGFVSDGFMYFNIINGVADVYQVFKAIKEQPAPIAPVETIAVNENSAAEIAAIEADAISSDPVVASSEFVTAPITTTPALSVEKPVVEEKVKTTELVTSKAKVDSKLAKKPRHHHYYHHQYQQQPFVVPQVYPQQYYQQSEFNYASQYQNSSQAPSPRVIDPYTTQQAYQYNRTIYGSQYNPYAAYHQGYYYYPQVHQNGTIKAANAIDLSRKETEKRKKREHRKKEKTASSSKANAALIATAVAVNTVNGDHVKSENKTVEVNEIKVIPTSEVTQLEQKVADITVA
jgi:hypothetical protein